MRTIEHWIGGKSTAGTATRHSPVWNPATGQQQAQVVLATREDVETVVRTAAAAFEQWAQVSLSRRTKVMFAFRELVNRRMNDLAEVISDEHSKVISHARGEVRRRLEVVEFACGNTFVLKPSERDPSVSTLVAELYAEAGLPEGVFNVVNGDKEAVGAILDHPDIAAVSFVGSTPIAHYIHEGGTATGKRVQALGGAAVRSMKPYARTPLRRVPAPIASCTSRDARDRG